MNFYSHFPQMTDNRTYDLTAAHGVHLSVALIVGEVDHHQQLKIRLHLREERRGGSFSRARPELHVPFILHRLKEKDFSYKSTQQLVSNFRAAKNFRAQS